MDDFTQRRIPKRKDRINLIWIVSAAAAAFPLAGLLIPRIGRLLFDQLLTYYIVGILILFLGVSAYQWWAWGNSWRNFAAENGLFCGMERPHGLALIQWPVIEGTFQGYQIRVERFTRGSGRYKKIYTAIQVALRESASNAMEINKTTWRTGLKNIFSQSNLQTIQLDNMELDRKLRVRSNSSTFARSVLASFDVQQRLVEIGAQAPEMSITVQGQELKFSERSSITDGDYLYALLQTLASCAAYVERHGRDA